MRFTVLRCVLMLMCWTSAALVQAQLALPTDVQASARAWLDNTLAQSAAPNLRIEVSVGTLDPRLRLSPCAQVEPYTPVGTKLWGKTRLGLRCVQGSTKWNVFLPITVKAFGPAWVIKGQVPSGAVLTVADAMTSEVDWADQNSPVIADPSHWIGQTATRSLSTGQVLRQDMVKPSQVFQAGAQVRVVAHGVGYEIATSAQAISAGVVGQAARVRMNNGNIMFGTVQPDQTVSMTL